MRFVFHTKRKLPTNLLVASSLWGKFYCRGVSPPGTVGEARYIAGESKRYKRAGGQNKGAGGYDKDVSR